MVAVDIKIPSNQPPSSHAPRWSLTFRMSYHGAIRFFNRKVQVVVHVMHILYLLLIHSTVVVYTTAIHNPPSTTPMHITGSVVVVYKNKYTPPSERRGGGLASTQGHPSKCSLRFSPSLRCRHPPF